MTDLRKPIFVVPLDLGNIQAGNVRAGYPASNLNRPKAAGLAWRTDGNGNLWARGDMEGANLINFCALMSANAQPSTTIRLRLGSNQAEVDGDAPYDSGPIPFISPSIVREDGLYHSHLELPSEVNAWWWRIDIAGHTGDFQASTLVLGKQIVPTYLYSQDHEFSVEDMGTLDITRFGVFDEEPGIIMRTLGFTLGWVTQAEYEGTFRPMIEKLGKRGALYICFSPEATTYRQARTYLGVLSKPPFARGVRKPQTFAQEYLILSPY